MDTNIVFDIQKKGIFLHRLVYIFFLLQRLLLQVLQRDVSLTDTIVVVALILFFLAVEEISYFKNYFNKILYVQVMRYLQCLLSSVLIGFLQMQDGSEVAVIGLPLLFMVDYFFSMEIADKDKVLSYSAMVGVPIAVIIIIKMMLTPESRWMFLFFDVLIILAVIFFVAYIFVDYIGKMDELLKLADWCMYYAKKHGRHRINVDDGSIERI